MTKKIEKEDNKNIKNETEKEDNDIVDNNNIETINIQDVLNELKAVKEELKNVKENSTKKMTDDEVKEMLERNKDIFKLSKADLDAMNEQTYTKTKEILAKEKKITTIIPKSELNPNDIVIPVMINGYAMQVNRGEEVELPISVYKAIKEGGYI